MSPPVHFIDLRDNPFELRPAVHASQRDHNTAYLLITGFANLVMAVLLVATYRTFSFGPINVKSFNRELPPPRIFIFKGEHTDRWCSEGLAIGAFVFLMACRFLIHYFHLVIYMLRKSKVTCMDTDAFVSSHGVRQCCFW